MLAGLGGGGTKGATLVTLQSGGSRWSPVASGLVMIILMIFGGAAGNYLPVGVLAGVITFVGIGMIELNIISGNIFILHFRRVKYIDLTGMILITQIASRAASKGVTLIFCHLREELGFGEKVSEAFKQIDKKSDFKANIFQDTDTAFEYAENLLLEREGIRVKHHYRYVPFAENNFCRDMPKNIVDLIEEITAYSTSVKGSEIFKNDGLVKSRICYSVHTSTSSARTEYQRVTPFTLSLSKGEHDFLQGHQEWRFWKIPVPGT